MPKSEISVIMITYNMGKYIEESIKSVLNQSFRDFELLVLDDCSTDNTSEIVATFFDDRIKYQKAEKNQGIPSMRNWGLELMQGKYMAILDSDDIAPPYRLQDQYDYMESHPEVGVLGGDVFTFGGRSGYQVSVQGNERIQYGFLFRCPIANPSVMVRKSVIDENRLTYDSAYSVCTDYKFWIELLGKTVFANLTDKPYLFYRTAHNESISTETKKLESIHKRDKTVNEMRFLFFKQFGFKINGYDYHTFIKFFSYQRQCCSQQDYDYLLAFFDDLREQGKSLMTRPDIWENVLQFWGEYAKKLMGECNCE